MRKISESILEKMKHGDWVSIVSLYESFNKQLDKTRRTWVSARIPKFYYRTLVILEENIISVRDNNTAKSMSTSNARAFTSLWQRLKKYLKLIDSEISQFRSSPETSDEDLISETIAETDNHGGLISIAEKKIDFFKAEKKDISFDMVDAKMKEIVLLRGKKGTNRIEAVELLSKLIAYAKCVSQEVEILINITSAQFDIAGSMAAHMSVSLWKDCVKNVLQIVKFLEDNPQINLEDHADSDSKPSVDNIMSGASVTLQGSVCSFTERLDDEFFKSLQCLDPHSKDYFLRLQDENLLLYLINEVSKYYESSDDKSNMVKMGLKHLEHIYYKPDEVYEAMSESNLIIVIKDEKSSLSSWSNADPRQSLAGRESLRVIKIRTLTSFVLKYGNERARARALLCEIYNEAFIGNFSEAHDKLLMSQLQGSISHADVSTQILFNRVIAQLGISAFRKGQFSATHAYLSELFSGGGGKVRELLAQGLNLNRFHDRSIEQEKIERRRQLPFHMHLNLDLLESIFLLSCTFTEVPKMNRGTLIQTRIQSKSFTRLIDIHEQQTFTGPAENVRETLMSATSSLMCGEWRVALKLIMNLESWDALPCKKELPLGYVSQRLKEEGLRIFLLQYAAEYASASFDVLGEMFDLSFASVYSVICSLISSDNLSGSCELSSKCALVTHVAPNCLQETVLSFVDKFTFMIESNDLALSFYNGSHVQNVDHEGEYLSVRLKRQSRFSTDAEDILKVGRVKSRSMANFSRSNNIENSNEGVYRARAKNLNGAEFSQKRKGGGKFIQRKREDFHERSDRLVPLFSATNTATNLLWQN